jgi:hypothetical protein
MQLTGFANMTLRAICFCAESHIWRDVESRQAKIGLAGRELLQLGDMQRFADHQSAGKCKNQ